MQKVNTMDMNNFDQKLRTSFHFVQNDIIALENEQYELLRRVERLEKILMRQLLQRQRITASQLIGNRETREVHTPDCLLARSMNFRDQIVFPSRQQAMQYGFTECICLA